MGAMREPGLAPESAARTASATTVPSRQQLYRSFARQSVEWRGCAGRRRRCPSCGCVKGHTRRPQRAALGHKAASETRHATRISYGEVPPMAPLPCGDSL